MMTPVALTPVTPAAVGLTIAGSDPSGGAGIQADLKTFTAFGVYGTSVITALTAQNTRGVKAVEVITAAFVRAQLSAVMTDIRINAIKTGMLANADIIVAVQRALMSAPQLPLVLDPVMVSTSGCAPPPAAAARGADYAEHPRSRPPAGHNPGHVG
jgi:hydroxymethylpyrimidine/phosphomethylpyrimidine kinase